MILATALAACGDDEGGGGAASGGAGGGDPLAEAEKVYKDAASEPNEWQGPTEPVKAKKGIKIGVLSCDSKLSGCTNPGKAAKMVVEKELGGTAKLYDGRSDPKVWNESMIQMVNEGVDGIIAQSLVPELATQGLERAKKAGIPVIRCCGGGGTPNPPLNNDNVFANVDIDFAAAGKASAAYVATKSKGKANVLVLDDSSQGGVHAHVEGFKKGLEELCPDCKQDTMQTQTADVTTKTPGQVVDYLRSHANIDWVYLGYDPQGIFIIPALQKAGMDDIQIAGILANPVNIDFMKKGQIQASDVAYDETYYGYAMIDHLQRALNDMPPAEPNSENAPWYLIMVDDKNFPTSATETTGWTAPFDYAAEYRKLWGLEGGT